ncbi:glutathione S-transferase [Ramlibacter sp. G-1-2-2]|uniref:Glutathione S-transferase n=1 Tax=Ramlibacter agri TaxID=2728837 RepID=A0A848H343_9BURK|nr:glutathione S-transferase [Ramlibacter agri]NML45386.1 glutathione S-transferase [Ramlibacter agri]
MIRLHGLAYSNYYNKAKMALLEKGVAFEEVATAIHGDDPEVLASSPLAKIPFLTLELGGLCESSAILEYLEAAYPTPPLLPADAYAAAKVRELAIFIDWHLEMAARQLYPSAFFGAAPLSDGNKARIRREIEQKAEAFARLAKFAPYVAGDSFTLADCCAFNSLPLVGMATRAIYGEDLLAPIVNYKAYIQFIGERSSAQKVVADRKIAMASR